VKKALLLLNIGTPDGPDEKSVGRFLREFLNDPYVVDVPQPFRWLLVNGLIVPRRQATSAKAYQAIWQNDGSPLLTKSLAFKEKLAQELPEYTVSLAMRYGRPSLREELQKIIGARPDAIAIWPLYPQYAQSSTETSLRAVERLAREMHYNGPISYIEEFSENRDVAALWVENILQAARGFSAQKLVLSYHGLPISHLKRIAKSCQGEGDCSLTLTEENKKCYRRQAFATAHHIRKLLFCEHRDEISFTSRDVEVSFQSRLTRGWIKPFSDELYAALPAKGVKRILVACPSFVTDCLETLEEVAIRERRRFIECGGEDMRLVPCLNESDSWVKVAARIVRAEKNWQVLKQ
jgi:protoporphyrin/coproporphyrin ferrochelatase